MVSTSELSGFLLGDAPFVVLGVEKTPELLDETENTLNAVGVPRFGHLNGPEEHFVHSQGVSSVFLHQIVRILHIVFRFGHFLPSSLRFSIRSETSLTNL